MSASTTVNILRYTALGLGVVYGFSHQRTITRDQKAEAVRHHYDHQVELINKAKAEYAKLKNPTSAGFGDPMDPKFDFEGYFTNLAQQNP